MKITAADLTGIDDSTVHAIAASIHDQTSDPERYPPESAQTRLWRTVADALVDAARERRDTPSATSRRSR